MKEVYIVSAVRTAIGSFGGVLASQSATQLGAHAIRASLERISLDSTNVQEVFMGNVLSAGVGQSPVTQATIFAGITQRIPGTTINKVCASGMKAVMLGTQSILLGDNDVVIAGGMESMSNVPYYLEKARNGYRLGHGTVTDGLVKDGLWDVYNDYHMGTTAENVAKKYGITRQDQDEFALASQNKAEAAQKAGKFVDEIVPYTIKGKKGDTVISIDEYPKHGTTLDILAGLRPAFDKAGTVTAGNASGINDGAAMVMLMSASKAKALGLNPLAAIKAYASTGIDPSIMGIGPISACKRCLEKAGWEVKDLDLMEINEAFAAQAIAVNREVGWDTTKINVNGGAIALGHPIGASGARVLVSLLHEMVRRDAKKGMSSLCIGGGMGVALAVER